MPTLPATEIDVAIGMPSVTVEVVSSPEINIELGRRGSPGAAGIPGPATDDLVLKAVGAIGGHRLVYAHGANLASYYQQDDFNLAGLATGFTQNSAIDSGDLIVTTNGELNGFAGLTPGMPYFALLDGNISKFPPITGLLVQIGYAVNATTLFINIGSTYVL